MKRPILFLFTLFCLLPALVAAATLSERTYKKLTRIHQMMGESQYAEAITELKALKEKVGGNDYEYATVMQTLGYAYAATDRFPQAIEAFREAIRAGGLPDEVQLAMQYNLAQLYASLPDYKSAAAAYEEWFAKAESPSADSFVFAATVYAQLANYPKGIEKIEKAIAMSEKPKESWYQLLLAMRYQQQSYREAAKVLETMVSLWPDNEKYWKQLSGIYFTLKDNRKALAVMDLAYQRGFLSEQGDLLNLVNLYLLLDIPFEAAQLLEAELNAGRIERSGKNLQKLADAWLQAQEPERSLTYLMEAAKAKREGGLYLRAAQIYADKEQWDDVLDAAGRALEVGLDDPGKAYLIRGVAYYELARPEQALGEFRKGARDEKTRKQAGQWIAHIQSELAAKE